MTSELTIENLITNSEITLDQRESIYLLDEVDWGVVESSHKSYKYINQIGVYVTGSTLETREIAIVGWVVGANNAELHSKRELLNTMINPLQLHAVHTQDFKLDFLPNSSIKYSVSYKENNEVMCKFFISGFCPDPLFSGKNDYKVEAASTYPMFHFPLIIPEVGVPDPDEEDRLDGGVIFGLREPSLLVNIENTGDVPTGMRIEFLATATVSVPRLIDAVTMEYIQINKTLTAGEKIVVVTSEGKKRVTGILNQQEENYYKYRDLNSTWLQLKAGDNLYKYDADSNVGGLEVTIYYNPRYLEVE